MGSESIKGKACLLRVVRHAPPDRKEAAQDGTLGRNAVEKTLRSATQAGEGQREGPRGPVPYPEQNGCALKGRRQTVGGGARGVRRTYSSGVCTAWTWPWHMRVCGRARAAARRAGPVRARALSPM